MRTHTAVQPTADIVAVKIVEGQFHLPGTFALSCPLPEQDRRLPQKLEEAIENAGQEIKRRLYQEGLLDSLQAGGGIDFHHHRPLARLNHVHPGDAQSKHAGGCESGATILGG